MAAKRKSRVKEPSTWAGIGLLATVAAQYFGVSQDAVSMIVQAATAVAGAAAVVMRERAE